MKHFYINLWTLSAFVSGANAAFTNTYTSAFSLATHLHASTTLSGSNLALSQSRGAYKAAPKKAINNLFAGSVSSDGGDGEWSDLTGEFSDDVSSSPAKKMVLTEGTGDVVTKGSEVEINYSGTLVSLDEWTADDVAECWLKNQQGLDQLVPTFLSAGIDGPKLMDEDFFNEDFVEEKLEVSNKIQRKKIVMAARRLTKHKDEFPEGTLFDSNAERGPYKFVLGGGKVIRGMDLVVSTMKVGEKSRLICRADYGYGSEGMRKMTGEVIVPPFATLCFDIELLSAE